MCSEDHSLCKSMGRDGNELLQKIGISDSINYIQVSVHKKTLGSIVYKLCHNREYKEWVVISVPRPVEVFQHYPVGPRQFNASRLTFNIKFISLSYIIAK